MRDGEDHGSSGVGTLILFIAMVLITTISAGVLMNTIGSLQRQAKETGDRTTSMVSTGIDVLSIVGDRNPLCNSSASTQHNIQVIKILAGLQSGSSPVNISNIVITVSNGDKMLTLHYKDSSSIDDADSTHYIVEVVRDSDNSVGREVLNRGDLVFFLICVDPARGNMSLPPNSNIDVDIIPLSGFETHISVSTPSAYVSRIVDIK